METLPQQTGDLQISLFHLKKQFIIKNSSQEKLEEWKIKKIILHISSKSIKNNLNQIELFKSNGYVWKNSINKEEIQIINQGLKNIKFTIIVDFLGENDYVIKQCYSEEISLSIEILKTKLKAISILLLNQEKIIPHFFLDKEERVINLQEYPKLREINLMDKIDRINFFYNEVSLISKWLRNIYNSTVLQKSRKIIFGKIKIY